MNMKGSLRMQDHWTLAHDHVFNIKLLYSEYLSKHPSELVSVCHWPDVWVGYCGELGELGFHLVTFQTNESSLITSKVTIVRSTEYSHNSSTMGLFIALLFHLMGSYQNVYIITKLPSLLSSRNFLEMSGPNPIDTPLLLGERPLETTGSAQSKSHILPFSGIYWNLMIYARSLMVTLSSTGSPPWQTITLWLKT